MHSVPYLGHQKHNYILIKGTKIGFIHPIVVDFPNNFVNNVIKIVTYCNFFVIINSIAYLSVGQIWKIILIYFIPIFTLLLLYILFQ